MSRDSHESDLLEPAVEVFDGDDELSSRGLLDGERGAPSFGLAIVEVLCRLLRGDELFDRLRQRV